MDLLTRRKREHEAHHREHSLQIPALHAPDNRRHDDPQGDQHGDQSQLLGPEPLHEFQTDGCAGILVGEMHEEVDPLVLWAQPVRVVVGVHEGVLVGEIFLVEADGDVVAGVLCKGWR